VNKYFDIFFFSQLLPRDAMQSAVMPQYVVCPFVTLRYADQKLASYLL